MDAQTGVMNIPLLTIAWVLGIAAVGGLVSYLNSPGQKSFGAALVVIVTSGFTGFMAYCICVERQYTTGWTTFIVGVAGLMGKRAWADFWGMVQARVGMIASANAGQAENEAEQ